MKTRRFVVFGLGATAVIGLGLFGTDALAESTLASMVRRRLSFLKLDDKGPDQFARDQIAALASKRPSLARIKTRISVALAKPYSRYRGISNDTRSRRERLEDNLATLYLLSSDFFTTGADPERTIHYVHLYDPIRACVNPFARPVAV